ncbi:MAG: hypothetical protein QNK11_02845 [Legionella sp.]|nr:hypothetical protein [Legionella sp.]
MSGKKPSNQPSAHQEKLNKFKQALKNNTYAINSDCITSALLEAQQRIKQGSKSIEQPEVV